MVDREGVTVFFFFKDQKTRKQCLDLLKGAGKPERVLRKRAAGSIPNASPETSCLAARRHSTPLGSSGKGGRAGDSARA